MAGVGIQKKGTGKAVRFGIGGAIQAAAYQGKPGVYEATQYVQSHFPQAGEYAQQESSIATYKAPEEIQTEDKKNK
jgi:hypothetical protein